MRKQKCQTVFRLLFTQRFSFVFDLTYIATDSYKKWSKLTKDEVKNFETPYRWLFLLIYFVILCILIITASKNEKKKDQSYRKTHR